MRVSRRPAARTVVASSTGLVFAVVATLTPTPWSWWWIFAGLMVGGQCCLLTFGLVGPGGLLRRD